MSGRAKKFLTTILNRSYTCKFHGEAEDLAPLGFKNYFYNLLTFGFYVFWGKTEARGFILERFAFMGQTFSFDGDGENAFKQSRAALFFIVCAIVIPLAVRRAFHMSYPALGGMLVFCLAFALPFAVFCWKNYKLNHTLWGPHRLSYNLPIRTYMLWSVGGFFLTVATAGLFFPFWRNKMFQLELNHMQIGDIKFAYSGRGRDIFWEYYWAIPFTCATGGFYLPWLLARIDRYKFANIWLGGDQIGRARGYLNVTGGDYLLLQMFSCTVSLLSFGFAIPWIQISNLKYKLDHLSFIGNLDLSKAYPTREKLILGSDLKTPA